MNYYDKKNDLNTFNGFEHYCSEASYDAFYYAHDQENKFIFYGYLQALINYSTIQTVLPENETILKNDNDNEWCLKSIESLKKRLPILEEKALPILNKYPELYYFCETLKRDINEGRNNEFHRSLEIQNAYLDLARKYDLLYTNSSFCIKPQDYYNERNRLISMIKGGKNNKQLPIDLLYAELWNKYLENFKLPEQDATIKDYCDVKSYFDYFPSNKDAFLETEEKIGELFGNIYVANFFEGADNVLARFSTKIVLKYINENLATGEDYDKIKSLAEIIKPDSFNRKIRVNMELKPLISVLVTNYLKKVNGKEFDNEELENIWNNNLAFFEADDSSPFERQLKDILNTLHEDVINKGYAR